MPKQRAWMLALLVAVLLAVPALANAQDCWECATDPDESGPYGVIHWDGDGFFPVSPPDGKHASWGTDYCTGSHVFMCNVDDEEALKLLAQAYVADDLDGIATAVFRLRDKVGVNASQSAIQVASCLDADVVVAHFPMDALSLDSLSVALEALATESESEPKNH